MNRSITDRDLAYDRIASEWHQFIDDYDTSRRLEVLIAEFLACRIKDRSVLDAGCGLGEFSKRLATLRPRRHVAVDIAPALVERLHRDLPQVDARTADLLNLDATLGSELFDVILCSEVIEHTPDPIAAIRSLASHLAPGGVLAITCPNALWKWSLFLAQALHIRKKYLGYENWLWASTLRHELANNGLQILRAEGIHLVPWQVMPKTMLRFVDRGIRKSSFGWSVNHAVLAIRDSGGAVLVE